MIYKFGSVDIEELRKLLPVARPEGIVISCHKDADGITAGVFSSYKYKIRKVNFPPVFGQVMDEDIMFDMTPKNDCNSLVVDHHPPKIDLPSARVILSASEEPASLISWHLFKDVVPREHWWKLMVGLAGDGHPERLPTEAWEASKCLLDDTGSFVYSKGKDYLFTYPIWTQLSSGINALARANWKEKAFDVLKEADTPYDVIKDPIVQEYKKKISEDTIRVFKESKPIDLGHVLLWQMSSMYSITGILASRLYETRKKTTVVLNTGNNSMSIRGVLARYLQEKLVGIVEAGGHWGFVGGTLLPDATVEQLKEALRRI